MLRALIQPVPIGDSDLLTIGEDLFILGYPGIGGETITFADGVVSGFTADSLLGEGAWIKTNATIAGGNSGGLAANLIGELVAVPTIAAAGHDIDPVDCRRIFDTNRDGVIDENDACVPIGGFLNGLRPVNLARDLIESAMTGSPYEPLVVIEEPDVLPDINPDFYDLMIVDYEPDRRPDTDLVWLDETELLCAYWEYEGMVNGARWDALWALDGELRYDVSFIDETWVGGEAGEWWVCVVFDEGGVTEGLWTLTLNVEADLMNGTWAAVGHDLVPYALPIYNELPQTICYLNITPDIAPFWGADWLGPEVWSSGEGLTFDLPPGVYDLRALDCDRRTLGEWWFAVPDDEVIVLE